MGLSSRPVRLVNAIPRANSARGPGMPARAKCSHPADTGRARLEPQW